MLAITGAAGQLGRVTLEQLVTKIAPDQLVAVVRNPAEAAALLPPGIHLRRGDYDDPASLAAAFASVTTGLLISGTDLAARTQQHQRVIDAARAAGVQRLVYTSGLGAAPEAVFAASPSHAATEDYLRRSGLTYTILRDTLYLDLLPRLFNPQVLASGRFAFAASSSRVSFALRAEIAEALAVVLTTPGHANQTYDIAPAPAYALPEVVAAVSQASGQPLAYVGLSTDELAATLRQQHVPEPQAAGLLNLAQAIAQGEFAAVSPTLAQLLGRRPTDLLTYLAMVYGQ